MTGATGQTDQRFAHGTDSTRANLSFGTPAEDYWEAPTTRWLRPTSQWPAPRFDHQEELIGQGAIPMFTHSLF